MLNHPIRAWSPGQGKLSSARTCTPPQLLRTLPQPRELESVMGAGAGANASCDDPVPIEDHTTAIHGVDD
eukprot:gene4285-15641_t